MNLNTTFTANDPQLYVTIDRQKAEAMGVPMSQITAAMGTFMGSSYVNDFNFNNRSYRVYVQADQQFRRNAADLRQYYVRSNAGQMVPLDNLVALSETSGPQVINHYNLFRSAEIDGSPAEGLSSGQGLDNMEKLFNKIKTAGHDVRVDRPGAGRDGVGGQGAADLRAGPAGGLSHALRAV